ncbi:MAG: aldolase/citrate lyase family protein [Pirellulaceae bacterium]
MSNNFRARLAGGETLLGTMITLASPATAEILAGVGFDWFFIDGEHGPLGTGEILAILQAVSHKVACVVRVPEAAETPIKQMLDIGAHGIIAPQVNTAEQAAEVVRWAKYAPLGARGVGLARAHGYGAGFAEYMARANDEIAVIVQAESATAVENIEAIARVEGIDAIQLGPYDLSASMGKMGQITDPDVAAAIDRICSVSKDAGLPVGCFGVTAEAVQRDIRRGATMICAGTDTLLLGQAASQMLTSLKEAKAS